MAVTLALVVAPVAVGAAAVLTHLGRVVQVDPIKPTLKAPGAKHLKLEFDEPPSNFGFEFNLRHYTWALSTRWRTGPRPYTRCEPPPPRPMTRW